MELTRQAEQALEALRRRGLPLRFTVDEVCHSARYRLSVRFRSDSGEARVGLAHSEDRAALERMRERLERSSGPATPVCDR